MRAVAVREHGGPDILRVGEWPDPAVGPTDVLVEVSACATNHLDVWVRRGVPGHHFPLPLVLGSDVAGIVRRVGEAVADVSPGDEVVVAPGTSCGHCAACLGGQDQYCHGYALLGEQRDGGYAELVAVPRANVAPKPEALSFAEAASFGVAFVTAWHMLNARAELAFGETVLVQAGASGVGSAAIQISKLLGATVIATASSQRKLDHCRALGADFVVNYAEHDVKAAVREITAGHGADVVIEHVGAATWESSVRSLAPRGRLVTCGATTGAEVQVNLRHLFFKSQAIMGSTMGSKGEFLRILELAAAQRLRPVVQRVLPLDEAAAAHRALEERQVLGKIVLVP